MASTAPKQPVSGRQALIAAIGIAAASVVVPTVAGFEGKSNDPYFDIVHVETVCFGETRVEMRRYSDAECADMLAGALAGFGREVLACAPSLKDHPNALAASVSLAYNIGATGFCRSTAARRFRAGDIAGGCDAFLAWNKAGGRVVRGLARRREAERQICRRGA